MGLGCPSGWSGQRTDSPRSAAASSSCRTAIYVSIDIPPRYLWPFTLSALFAVARPLPQLREFRVSCCPVSAEFFVQFATILPSRVEGVDVDESGEAGETAGAGHRLEDVVGDLGVVCFSDPYR